MKLRLKCTILITIVFQMLEDKLKKGLKMIGEYVGDDDSGLDVDTDALEMEEPIDPEKLSINLKVINWPSLRFLLLINSNGTYFFDSSFSLSDTN